MIGPSLLMRLRTHLPTTPAALAATLLALVVVSLLLVRLADFVVLDASWHGTAADCRASAGLCWAFLRERGATFVYGYYPVEERWRLDLLLALVLLAGLLVATLRRHKIAAAAGAFLLPAVGAAFVLGGVLGAPPPSTAQLGGFCLTLLLSLAAIAMGLPFGLGLALMRESDMPVLRVIAASWIEWWRGLPTIVVLFFAIAAFPLLVPPNTEIDKVLRVLAAFTFLTSALFAEALRAGLRAVGAGQSQAARALSLKPLMTLRLVVLPQALGIAAPNIVNVSIALIKETTLVLVIGLYDLFGMIQNATVDPRFASESVTLTGYAMAACGYLLLCFGLSSIARRLEKR
jgi:general L-amino acid transport system permease protein